MLRFGGRGEVKTLRSAEAVSLALPLSGITLYSGLYINELSPAYWNTRRASLNSFRLLALHSVSCRVTGTPEPALRRFELALLGHLGYGVNFTHCAGSGEPVDDTMTYRYREEKGLSQASLSTIKRFTGRY